jgi:hypothetical protein
MRSILAWLIGIGVEPTITVVRYLLNLNSGASDHAFHFGISYVWPMFAMWGLIGFALLQIRQKHFIPMLFVGLGITCGLVTGFIASYFDANLIGYESRLAARLALDGVFCFSIYYVIATGPHKFTGNGNE